VALIKPCLYCEYLILFLCYCCLTASNAQHLFFGHSQAGDLRPYLCGYFDTSSGLKGEAGSYHNIQLTLGVDDPSEVLFATDMLPEAQAAQAAGWQAVLVVRPGNKPLPEDHGFRVVESMQELLKQ
jgi:methylthioribulose 1-phosphate dehydratase/enolase-phosphatase E1